MEEFSKLGISEPILKAIEDQGFTEPSEIQRKTIPLVLQHKDVLAESATGSGKTLAFATGIITECQPKKGIQALVLTPTRELAVQVADMHRTLSRHKRLQFATVYGGVAINPQMDAIARSEVVIGTPGRILDHLERRTLDLSNVGILVLDEADRMLDMGFIDDVEKIIRQCKPQRQTLLFSATLPPDITTLAHKHMKSPIKVTAESFVDPSKLQQSYFDVPDKLKFSLLVHLIKAEKSGLCMVFCNSQRNTDFISSNLKREGVDAVGIHGGLSQAKRNSVLKMFHDQRVSVLVCTDVAARGLDIKGVSHVYNYDIPKDAKQYIHRIGRTARAGKEGKAINILSSRDHENYQRVLNTYDVKIHQEEMPHIQQLHIRWNNDRPEGRFGRSDSGPRSHGRPGAGRDTRHSGPRKRFGKEEAPRRSSGPRRGDGSRRGSSTPHFGSRKF